MPAIATHGVAWLVHLSACPLVTFVSLQKRLNQSRCHLGRDPHGPHEWAVLGGCLHIQKYCKSILHTPQQKSMMASAALYVAKEIIQSSITARHAMRFFVEILGPPVIIIIIINL